MRVLFMGSGVFAVPALRAMAASDHKVVGVITQPARPAGRKGELRRTPVALEAESLALTATECANVNGDESVRQAAALAADVICVVDFGQLVRRPMRQAARLGAFNVHGSILPALRGAAPVNWAIINGLTRTGVTTFSLVDKMDAGPIYLALETDIRPAERADELKSRLAELGAEAARQTLDMLAAGDAQPTEQDHGMATLAPKLIKADGVIDWSAEAVAVRNRIHGTWPWPGGQAVLRRTASKDCPVTIAAAEVVADASGQTGPGEAGALDDGLNVTAGSGTLRILQIKPAGKRLMAWPAFVNGYRAAPGDRFSPPETSND